MRFAFTDDQLALADAVRALLAKECPPPVLRAAWVESDKGAGDRAAVDAVWARLAEMGVLGVAVPETLGGLGLDELGWVLLAEEAGRAALPLPFVETVAVVAPLLAGVATDTGDGGAVAADVLPAILSGRSLVAVEGMPGAPVPFAEQADLVLARRGGALHLVPAGVATLAPVESVDRSRSLARVTWEPSATTLLTGEASRVALAFDRGALGVAAELIGLGGAMVDLTVAYVAGRRQFGVPVGSFQAVKHRLADARLALEFARPAVHRAAHSLAVGAATRERDVSMAKAMASDAATAVAAAALQCHGAMGYTTEYDLHLWMKRAWALARAWGDAAWHRDRVGRALGV